MKTKSSVFGKGFTLIEVIITLVALAIVAAMLAGFFGTSITESSTPVFRLRAVYSLNQTLEKMTALYCRIPHWRTATVYAVGDIVLPTTPNSNGYQYRCTVAGTSDAGEPAWRTDSVPFADGTASWANDGAAPTLASLQTAIGAAGGGESQDYTKTFGSDPAAASYFLVENRFIKFDGTNTEVNINNTPADPLYGRYLKVTIKPPSNSPNNAGETLTALFVRR